MAFGFESPFCALAVPVDLNDGAIDHRERHVRFIRHGVEYALEYIGLPQSRNRLNTEFHLPKCAGRSRYGLPVRAIQRTASKKTSEQVIQFGAARISAMTAVVFMYAGLSHNSAVLP